MASVPSSGIVAWGLTATEWLGPASPNVAIPMPDRASPDGILPSKDPGKGWGTQTSALRYRAPHPSSTTGGHLSWVFPLTHGTVPPSRPSHPHMGPFQHPLWGTPKCLWGSIPPTTGLYCTPQPPAGLSWTWDHRRDSRMVGVLPNHMWD